MKSIIKDGFPCTQSRPDDQGILRFVKTDTIVLTRTTRSGLGS